MQVFDNKLWHDWHSADRTHNLTNETMYTALLFASVGAIAWAVRGTGGWGGVDGTILPGLLWGLLWHYAASRRGIDARGIIFWLGMGIALGGELGYGQYTGWILGRFSVGEEVIHISPLVGYLWFFICGIGWAAPGGIVLGWALGDKATPRQWGVRSALLVILLLFLFAWPLIDWLSAQLVQHWPGFFPNAKLGIYVQPLGKHLSRTIYTNTQNGLVLLWWLAALLVAILQRDKMTLRMGLLLGLGFGLGFTQSALWCLGYGSASGYIDWWKMWELNAGFNLGLLYAIAFFVAIKFVQASNQKNSDETAIGGRGLSVAFQAVAGSLLLFVMSFEYFFWTGIGLIVLYVGALLFVSFSSTDSNTAREKQKSFFYSFSLFLLLFLLFHGGSERGGLFLGLYDAKAVDQYAWPAKRIALFAPFALILVYCFIRSMRNINKGGHMTSIGLLPNRRTLVDVITFLGFIGALSIWPAKIGVLYAFSIILALHAMMRMDVHHKEKSP